MHNATAITTGSANQRPNTPCIRLWIDVTFRGPEDCYYTWLADFATLQVLFAHKEENLDDANAIRGPLQTRGETRCPREAEMLKSFWTCQSFGLILKILSVRTIRYAAEILNVCQSE